MTYKAFTETLIGETHTSFLHINKYKEKDNQFLSEYQIIKRTYLGIE